MLLEDADEYKRVLESVSGLSEVVDTYITTKSKSEKLLMMEFVLFALSECNVIGKNELETSTQFIDVFQSIISGKGAYGQNEN